MLQLPNNALLLISKNLNRADYLNFKNTCQTFLKLEDRFRFMSGVNPIFQELADLTSPYNARALLRASRVTHLRFVENQIEDKIPLLKHFHKLEKLFIGYQPHRINPEIFEIVNETSSCFFAQHIKRDYDNFKNFGLSQFAYLTHFKTPYMPLNSESLSYLKRLSQLKSLSFTIEDHAVDLPLLSQLKTEFPKVTFSLRFVLSTFPWDQNNINPISDLKALNIKKLNIVCKESESNKLKLLLKIFVEKIHQLHLHKTLLSVLLENEVPALTSCKKIIAASFKEIDQQALLTKLHPEGQLKENAIKGFTIGDYLGEDFYNNIPPIPDASSLEDEQEDD